MGLLESIAIAKAFGKLFCPYDPHKCTDDCFLQSFYWQFSQTSWGMWASSDYRLIWTSSFPQPVRTTTGSMLTRSCWPLVWQTSWAPLCRHILSLAVLEGLSVQLCKRQTGQAWSLNVKYYHVSPPPGQQWTLRRGFALRLVDSSPVSFHLFTLSFPPSNGSLCYYTSFSKTFDFLF